MLRVLLPLAGAVALVVGIACGGTADPTAAPAVAATTAPAAMMAEATPTHTPPPDATIRPTNTPAPTAAPRVVATPTPSVGTKHGGTLLMSAYADTRDWDPLGSASLSSVISYSQIYNQLVQYDTTDTNQVVGDLASNWEVSSDGQTYTFHLRDGMQWTDGTPITSNDVVTTLARYANPCNSTGRSGLWRNYTVKMEVVELADKADCTPTNQDDVLRAVDDSTVEFNLEFAPARSSNSWPSTM